jgi:hypothetical protein
MKQRNSRRWERLLFLTPLLLFLWPVVQILQRDELDRELRKLAGPSATDCGVGAQPPDWQQLDTIQNCMAASFRAGKPFFSRDNDAFPASALGIVRTPSGRFYYLIYSRKNWFSGEITYGLGQNMRIVTVGPGMYRLRAKKFLPVTEAEVRRQP